MYPIRVFDSVVRCGEEHFKTVAFKLISQYERHNLGEDKLLEISYSNTKILPHFVSTDMLEANCKSNI